MQYNKFPKDRSLKERLIRKYLWPILDTAYSMKRWDRHDRLVRHFFPIRYFLFESIPTWCRGNIYYPYTNTREWIRFRTIDKYHVLKIDTKPGYMDPDSQLLLCAFQILLDFVEIEMAAANGPADNKWHKKFRNQYRWRRRLNIRDGEKGIEALRESMDANAIITRQDYLDVIDLYRWWTVERQHRIKPYDDDNLLSAIYGDTRDYYLGANEIEDFYYQQDTEMLMKLMSVRKRLWY